MIPPGSRIGILGGGQLGRMSAIAAAYLGYHVHVFSPMAGEPAEEVAHSTTIAPYEDMDALERFAHHVDVITFEFENIPFATAAQLEQWVPVRPSAALLHTTQHREREKNAVRALGIETAPFAAVTDAQTLIAATQKLGFPCILKTSEQGYDGKGQCLLRSADELAAAAEWMAGRACVLEGFVDFERELSVIVARSAGSGEVKCFPVVENIHRQQILHRTLAPAVVPPSVAAQAEDLAIALAEGLKLEGLLAVELFLTKWGSLIVNELAPRPHNSGHWTLDACATSQFEQHIRAVCGLPLGDTTPLCAAEMLNLIGSDVEQWQQHLRDPRAKLHLYGKREAREGRKMGHVTFLK